MGSIARGWLRCGRRSKEGQGSALDPLGPLPQTPTIKNRSECGEAKKSPLIIGFASKREKAAQR